MTRHEDGPYRMTTLNFEKALASYPCYSAVRGRIVFRRHIPGVIP